MPFFVSPVDPRVTPGFEIALSPGPTVVEYPGEMNGQSIETADGRVVVQQPTNDARVRSWVWRGFPGRRTQYETQYILTQTFRSRYRQEMGQSPYVWIRDTTTRKLRRKINTILTVSSSGSTATVLVFPSGGGSGIRGLFGAKIFKSDIFSSAIFGSSAGGSSGLPVVLDPVVEILSSSFGGTGTGANQIRDVTSIASTTITCSPFNTIPHGAKIRLTGWYDDWFRARVIDVSRQLRNEGGLVRYDTTQLMFVIEDNSYNDLG